ncbi:PREDICTED: putative nuclease HARBI1 [Cyphomyrmex costatus]|uniref:putative nuclease HARBI1 n=1 Tax=Cyphomyrmex costatus TaxID=456900 RepID=UPI00085232B5|nr:PREDICTED: putative nuclease HARBI1 [Cyphomyrmex costatus]
MDRLNEMLMAMITLVIQAQNQAIRYAEATMQKVTQLFYIYNCLKQLNKRPKRKMWVRSIFSEQRRLLQGASNNLIVEMQLSDKEKYFNYLRMSPTMFNELLTIVGPRIEKQKVVRNPISAKTRLHVTVRWLASSDSMTSLSYAYRIAQCTLSHIIPETCEQIWLALKDRVLINATENNWRKVAEDFERICQHVVIQAPPRSGSSYYNYKGSHSINLLAICDALKRFLVDIGAQGRQSDGGDEAFPISTYMMRPYPRSGKLNTRKKIFNYRLSRGRRTIECAFGILVARWRLFRRPIIASTFTCMKAIQATVVMHNFIIDQEVNLPAREKMYSIMRYEERNLLHTSTGLIDINNSNISQN